MKLHELRRIIDLIDMALGSQIEIAFTDYSRRSMPTMQLDREFGTTRLKDYVGHDGTFYLPLERKDQGE